MSLKLASVQPVAAATVILVRESAHPEMRWQCYMVRRHVKSEFAADVFVFPGGKVDPCDNDTRLVAHSFGQPEERASGGEVDRALRFAAIRELFEEAGVLLACRADGSPFIPTGADSDRFRRHRHALHDGTLSLAELALREQLAYLPYSLSPISRWITPEHMPRRFDTRFFVARLPTGQEPDFDDRETSAGEWIAPIEALGRFRDGDFPLVWATEVHLERLAAHASIDSLVAAAKSADLSPVTPKLVQREGGTVFVLPGEEGY